MRKFEKVKRIEEDIKLPERSTKNSAGYDFFAIEDTNIEPISHSIFETMTGVKISHNTYPKPTLLKTGIKVAMNDDEFLMLCNRSSNPGKKNLVLANGVGVIDSDYYGNPDNDGEIMFAFYNVGNKTVQIKRGDKIGQGIFTKYEVTDDDNAYGERIGGLGSTGE